MVAGKEDSSPYAKARVLEAAEAVFITAQNQSVAQQFPNEGFSLTPLGTGVVAITKPLWMWKLNHVAGLGMDGPVTEKDIETIEALFARIGIAPFINLSQLAHPDASGLLMSKGYTVVGAQCVYVFPLEHYQLDGDEPANRIKITSVSEEDKPTFVRNSIEGFKSGGRAVELLEILAKSATLRKDTRLYFAKIDGSFAGGAGLAYLDTPFGQVAELYIDSTIPDFRGRGVQTALLKARLAEAKKNGIKRAVVNTRPGTGSPRNIERVGFKLAYQKETFTKLASGETCPY
ncbi:GNAT family N-acetyltransferase [Aspergillus stella-maris]|uniref:GNAT family N-acetyltransferase n=1 Tax=Aspergillus stella-maris TaxID=1810926 RepID=UPI003CCE0803